MPSVKWLSRLYMLQVMVVCIPKEGLMAVDRADQDFSQEQLSIDRSFESLWGDKEMREEMHREETQPPPAPAPASTAPPSMEDLWMANTLVMVHDILRSLDPSEWYDILMKLGQLPAAPPSDTASAAPPSDAAPAAPPSDVVEGSGYSHDHDSIIDISDDDAWAARL